MQLRRVVAFVKSSGRTRAHWTVLSPFLDLNSPSRVASRSTAQGREARTTRPAQRLGVRTLAAGDGDAIAAPSLFLLLLFTIVGQPTRSDASPVRSVSR